LSALCTNSGFQSSHLGECCFSITIGNDIFENGKHDKEPHKFACKILDASWSTFRIMCKYKANRIVEVRPAYFSIDCSSRCGHPVPRSLAVRTHCCPKCSALIDRNHNSAINHLQNGLKLLHLTTGGAPGSNACRDCKAVEEAGSPRINSWVVHIKT
jgi:transposase